MFGPTVMIMLGEILTRRNNRGMEHLKPLIRAYLKNKREEEKKRKRKHEGKRRGEKNNQKKKKKYGIWSLSGLKTRRQSMQKSEGSH